MACHDMACHIPPPFKQRALLSVYVGSSEDKNISRYVGNEHVRMSKNNIEQNSVMVYLG